MKKETAANQRKKLAAIQPVFIEWNKEVFLINSNRNVVCLSTEIIDSKNLSDWAKVKKALTSPVAIKINKDPKIGTSKVLFACSGLSMSSLPRVSVKYGLYTKLSLINKLSTKESMNFVEYKDDIELIHGISRRSARAALCEAYRLHVGHFTQHDSDDGEPSQTIKSKPILKTLEAHHGSMQWRISAWLLWDQFINKDLSCDDRAAALSLLIKDCDVTSQALRTAAKEVGLSLGGN
jgi:hypothetical protein